MSQIALDPGAGAKEKADTLAMLRRFEEAAADGEDAMAALEAEEGDEDDLAAALDGVDLGTSTWWRLLTPDNIDSNELFRLLPPLHRDAFLAAMRDPESEETRELLADAAAGGLGEAEPVPPALPWWEARLDGPTAASPPPPVDASVIDAIQPPPGVGPKLVYNVLAVVWVLLPVIS